MERQMTIYDVMTQVKSSEPAKGKIFETARPKPAKETQEQKIINYMKAHGGITPFEAIEHLKILRLGARIFDLREKGYNIVNDPIPETNYARYKLMEDGP